MRGELIDIKKLYASRLSMFLYVRNGGELHKQTFLNSYIVRLVQDACGETKEVLYLTYTI